MKTPEEIKKGLECCGNDMFLCPDECPYIGSAREGSGCAVNMSKDALALIQRLEIRNGAIEKALDEVFVLNDKQASIIRSLNSNNSQVRKALQDNGFQTLEELLQAYSQVKRERDAVVRWVLNEEDAKNYKIPENFLTKQQMENLYLVGSDGKVSKMFCKRKEGENDV